MTFNMIDSSIRGCFSDPIVQFSIHTENKVGRLSELTHLLDQSQIHIMALTTVDTTDNTILRVVVDRIDEARSLLHQHRFFFSESDVIGVEIADPSCLKNITCALLQAEINIHYIYPFLTRPKEKIGIIMGAEDLYTATEVLHQNQIQVLHQGDITR